MVSKNDITGDELKSKLGNKAYEDGWERIFGGNNKGKQRTSTDDVIRVLEQPADVQGGERTSETR